MELSRLGWNDFFASVFEPYSGELEPARVVSYSRGIYRLLDGGGEAVALLAGAFRGGEHPVTGDWVVLDSARGVIVAALPRQSKISRKKAGRTVEEQVLAANVDVVFVVTALDGDFNPRRLERYLVMALEGGARPVVVLNKSDLCDDPLPVLRAADSIAVAAGDAEIPVLLVSALENRAVEQLASRMKPGQTAALAGSSGVGKSTIVNRLLGAERQAVLPVREHDQRGRHTTTSRELFLLEEGWLLIDTPGLRELEPWTGPESLDAVFGDIESLAAGCRFRDCRHSGEPGCAVAGAVREGALEEDRLASFHKLQAELAHLRRMQDAHAAADYKRMVKRMHRRIRNMPPKG